MEDSVPKVNARLQRRAAAQARTSEAPELPHYLNAEITFRARPAFPSVRIPSEPNSGILQPGFYPYPGYSSMGAEQPWELGKIFGVQLGRYFPLPSVYCLVWICLDVLFCTASIMHLCTISVDRYLSLRYPMKFGRNKTRRRVTLKIIFVWILSIAMSLPLSLMYSIYGNIIFSHFLLYCYETGLDESLTLVGSR
ncbi:5-hydroxytryptamine receptor 2A [Eufriesea mexicana]|uniref:5-hydroxytryptamine receptor 2A n=1 Tax=Eufriesea mexicana TaxID=516756 RepID=A0A310SIR1_9HYME|nr:5-hydroxytryptamine receptor 2A [Eufriesea mexicana]